MFAPTAHSQRLGYRMLSFASAHFRLRRVRFAFEISVPCSVSLPLNRPFSASVATENGTTRLDPHCMMPEKKRPLSDEDVVDALDALQNLQESLVYEESGSEEPNETGKLGAVLAAMRSLSDARAGRNKV